MANTSTPRLKAYRLDSNYSQESDNDIQSMTDDELLPVIPKDLNPFNTEEMVGVRMRQDARLVVGDADYTLIGDHQIQVRENQLVSANALCCEGWVLGKGNIRVYVYRGKTGDTESATLVAHNDAEDYSQYSSSNGGQWIELDRKFWDYTVESQKTYLVAGQEPTTVMPASGDYEIHEMDWITFSIGNMLTKSNAFFSSAYSTFVPIETKGIKIQYRKYMELGDGAGFVGGNRAPFGDIYNGNKEGRCLNLMTTATPPVAMTSPDSPVHILERGDAQVDYSKMNYYEGNYLFRRGIYPLRFKVIHQGNSVVSDFAKDCDMDENGRATVPCELSWFMDDIMKPVVFERITLPDGRRIFKQLARKQATVQYQNTNEGGDHYIVALNMSYYKSDDVLRNPKEFFLVYNYVDDSLGNVFDFNYDYMSNSFSSSTVKYGYANDGTLVPAKGQSSLPSDLGSYVYVKREILAVRTEAGRDASRDLVLSATSSNVSFSMASPVFDTAGCTVAEAVERNRLIDGIASFDPSHGMRIYVNGVFVCSLDTTNATQTNQTIDGVAGYTVSYNGGSKTVTISNGDVSSITEVLLVYYEKHAVSFSQSGGANPYCVGYRVPCYEKVKTSTLFVSSYPNWVKGHVNNDLDIFYGNKLYSGTELKGTTVERYHDIYPEYVKDGWYAMYSEGAVEFNEAKTERNYFDVMNYSVFASSPADSIWNEAGAMGFMPNYWASAQKLALEYKKVRYNVAHYDGIYSVMRGRMTNYSNRNGISRYMLLEDDDFMDYVDKRWVGRSDAYIRRMLETGRDEVPRIVHTSKPEGETGTGDKLTLLSSLDMGDGDIATVNTENDRICAFSIPNTAHVVLSFWSNPTPAEVLASENDNGDYIRVHAKVRTVDGIDMLCLGLEKSDLATFSRANVFAVADSDVAWACLPDMDGAYVGTLADDVYQGIDIGVVQTSEITIDGNSRNGGAIEMKYWVGDTEPAEGEKTLVPSNGYVAPTSTAKVIRYRYHNDGASWSYDVCFEVMSYNEDNVEVIAYRVMTK